MLFRYNGNVIANKRFVFLSGNFHQNIFETPDAKVLSENLHSKNA